MASGTGQVCVYGGIVRNAMIDQLGAARVGDRSIGPRRVGGRAGGAMFFARGPACGARQRSRRPGRRRGRRGGGGTARAR